MNNTSNTNTVKRGRPRKSDSTVTTTKVKKIDQSIPVLLEPNIHDIHDELSRMDSYIYSQYNE